MSLSLDYKPLGQECSEQCHTHQGEEDADGPSLGDVARKSRDGAPLRDSPMSILDSSWGPSTTEAGDTKIVAAGCTTPLILRKVDDGHQFIGGIWLIDSELEFQEDEDYEGRFELKLKNNPGFSRLMYGAGCEGKTGDDVEIYTLV